MADKRIFANSGPSDPDIKRSVFDKSFYNNLTARIGRIYPIFLEEAPPNSTYEIRPSFGFSLMPLVFPVQTNINCHISFFKAPFRILMKSYEDFAVGVGNHVMPFISRDDNWCETGSLADYMGIPTFMAQDYFAYANVKCRTQTLVHPAFANVLQSGFTYLVYNALYSGDLNSAFPVSAGNAPSVGFVGEKLEHMLYDNYIRVPYVGVAAPSVSAVRHICLHLFVDGVDKLYYDCTGETSATDEPSEKHYALSSTSSPDILVEGAILKTWDFVFHVSDVFKQVINDAIASGSNVNLALCTAKANSSVYGSLDYQSNITDRVLYVPEGEKTYFYTGDGLQPFFSYKYQEYRSVSPATSPFVGVNPDLKINALPFRMYEMIYNYHFRNSAIDPLVIDGQTYYNRFLTNDGDGADSTTPLDFKQAMFEPDLFSTCLPSPQLGYAPLVGITYHQDTDEGVLHLQPAEGDPYDVTVGINAEGDMLGVKRYADNADETTLKRLEEMINIGISINDLRNASALQRWCERRNKSGLIYHDYVYEMFGTHAPDGDHFPEYLGGYTQRVNVGKIENTALSAQAELGQFAGTANCVGSSEEIKVFCREQSYIMGIMYFTVTPIYSQQLPAHFAKRELLDYYNPQFAHIGLQPVFNYQIAPLQADSSVPGNGLYDTFGFNRPFGDYVQRLDEAHGDFRKEGMQRFLLQRQFGSMPHLNADFLNINSQDLTDIFAYTLDSDKIYGQIYFDVKATLPIPRFMNPQIL